MPLELLKQFGKGGSGIPDQLRSIVTELQGLSILAVAGAAANTKIVVPALRQEDTIICAIMSAAGVLSNLAAVTIDDIRASGTLTVGAVVTGNTVTVNGKVYTYRPAATANLLNREVAIGANATETAANLARAINLYDAVALIATSAAAVVTVRAAADGVGGNAITLAASANTTVSGATLTGGSADGGFRSTTASAGNTVLLAYFNKK